MKNCLISMLAALCAVSCIYPYQPDISQDVNKTVVVDGNILVGGISTISVGYLSPLDGYLWDAPRASAVIEDDQGNQYRPSGAVSSSSYLYIPTDSPQALAATSFRAVVTVDGETYVSDWTTPDPAPVITDIHFSADDNNVYVTADLETPLENPGYMGFLYEETWEFHSDFYPIWFVNTETWAYETTQEDYPYYWCYRTYTPMRVVLADLTNLKGGIVRNIPVNEFSRYDGRNHKRYSILVKAFALSKEAYQFNKQMQEMSDLGGDLFSPDPGALEGNLVCESDPTREVMGMVLSGRVTTRRAFLDDRYQYVRRFSYPLVEVPLEEMPLYYYDMDFRPIDYMEIDGQRVMGWAPERCINCIVAGGTQIKPDFWD